MDIGKLLQDIYTNTVANGRWLMLLRGLGTTLEISFFAILLGVTIGFVMAYMRMSRLKVLQVISGIYIDIIRGTPAVTQLLIIYYSVFASLRGVDVLACVVAMGINSGAYVAEIIRAGIMSIDKGQAEAGQSLGLNKRQVMQYIILPQAVKNILPAFANEFIVLIKETAIVGYIAVEDLTKVGNIIRGQTFSMISLFATAIIYFIVIKTLTIVLRKFEASMRTADER